MRFVGLNLLLLAGCGTGSYYPVYAPGSLPVDTGPGGQGDEPEIPCGEDGPVGQLQVSVQYGWPTALAFYEVIPMSCGEEKVFTLAPGDAWQGSVATGHTWVVRETDGAFVDMFQVPSGVNYWAEVVP